MRRLRTLARAATRTGDLSALEHYVVDALGRSSSTVVQA
jgi:hypothetical protein